MKHAYFASLCSDPRLPQHYFPDIAPSGPERSVAASPLRPERRLFDEKALVDSFDHDSGDDGHELDHLVSQLALCVPPVGASLDELLGFRELLLEAARAVSQRSRFLAKLRSFALTDDLTGLYNRRGFFILGLQQLKLARRTGQPLLLFFADIDQFKLVNDSLGHIEGDAFLICCAEVLTHTFRDSDIVARLGGDEFAILAQGGTENGAGAIFSRFESALQAVNRDSLSRHKLSLSIGHARFDPQNPVSLGELLSIADNHMFELKRARAASTTLAALNIGG
jgi:diguanylate cyclase (GGDEF)-like protein